MQDKYFLITLDTISVRLSYRDALESELHVSTRRFGRWPRVVGYARKSVRNVQILCEYCIILSDKISFFVFYMLLELDYFSKIFNRWIWSANDITIKGNFIIFYQFYLYYLILLSFTFKINFFLFLNDFLQDLLKKNFWKNTIINKTWESMLSVKFNFNLTCEKFYDFLLKSQKLFVKYIAYKNTTLKHKMWYIFVIS